LEEDTAQARDEETKKGSEEMGLDIRPVAGTTSIDGFPRSFVYGKVARMV
jgi:hypothetical protein